MKKIHFVGLAAFMAFSLAVPGTSLRAQNIQDLEKEPAYIRRNIQLDNSIPSEEDNTSRFSVSNDENGSSSDQYSKD